MVFLGLSEAGWQWGVEALFNGVCVQPGSFTAECSGEDCLGDDWVTRKQVSGLTYQWL